MLESQTLMTIVTSIPQCGDLRLTGGLELFRVPEVFSSGICEKGDISDKEQPITVTKGVENVVPNSCFNVVSFDQYAGVCFKCR